MLHRPVWHSRFVTFFVLLMLVSTAESLVHLRARRTSGGTCWRWLGMKARRASRKGIARNSGERDKSHGDLGAVDHASTKFPRERRRRFLTDQDGFLLNSNMAHSEDRFSPGNQSTRERKKLNIPFISFTSLCPHLRMYLSPYQH